jgi:hypothetical protein
VAVRRFCSAWLLVASSVLCHVAPINDSTVLRAIRKAVISFMSFCPKVTNPNYHTEFDRHEVELE